MSHVPVLLNEVLRALGDINGKIIIDCTFGAGGYSRAFLELGANVIAFDRDQSVAPAAEKLKSEYPARFTFINKPFSELGDLAPRKFDAIVFDLGVSSMQIDQAARGFSFRFDGPLDMRMGQEQLTAAQLIENLSVNELAKVLRDYGDVKKAVPIARAMKEKLPRTTYELRDLIFNPKDIAPVFQALRIAVNDELGEVERALAAVPDLLASGGVCAVVTFHSLEDRLVKNTMREWTTALGDPRLPTIGNAAPFKMLKPVVPGAEELKNNPRSRSAHLRSVVKI